jgi:hypothetical protein
VKLGLNLHSSTDDESDDTKGQLLGGTRVCSPSIPEVPREILLGDLNANVEGKYMFKPATRYESLYEISNDTGLHR